MEDINLRQFLRIKEIALDSPIKENSVSEDNYAVHTSIEEELKLLLASGENRHYGSGDFRQFQSKQNSQSILHVRYT